MSDLGKSLSEEQVKNLEAFLSTRFTELQDLRRGLDDDIQVEIEAYNNVDRLQEDQTESWEERVTVPVLYSNVQTAKAKLLSELFAVDNYIRIYVENDEFLEIQSKINTWVQKEIDKTRLDRLAKDFLEDALVQRVNWVHVRAVPIMRKKHKEEGVVENFEGYKIDLQSYKFIDVWFDTRVTNVMKTDFFVRKTIKAWELMKLREVYNLNLEEALETNIPADGSMGRSSSDDETVRDAEYRAKHESSGADRYGTANKNIDTEQNIHSKLHRDMEIMEYMGVVDVGTCDYADPEYVPDMREVIITWVNRSTIVSIQENTIPTAKKRLMFPIRPLRQANSLIGKGIPQLTKDQQHLFNRYESLSVTNADNIVKGTFIYDTNSGIDLDELFLGGGNAIGVDGDPTRSIFPFPHQNLVGVLAARSQQQRNYIQDSIGTVDVITGAGGNIPDTASGQRSLTEQANFKFMMMGENVADDLSDVIKYCILLLIHYDKPNQMLQNIDIAPFLEQDVITIENDDNFDVGLVDITSRRDVEQNQWANLVGILAPVLEKQGGDVMLLISHLMDAYRVPDKERILSRGNPTEIAQKLLADPALAQAVMTTLAQLKAAQNPGGTAGGAEQNAENVPGGDAIERQANENLST